MVKPLGSVAANRSGFWEGRSICVLLVLLYFVLLGALTFLGQQPYWMAWRTLAVPACKIPFVDLVNVPAAAKSVDAGLNPYLENPFDPLQRVWVYPHWWLESRYLGLTLSNYIYFGFALGLCFALGALYSLGRLSKIEGGIAGFFLISPNVMFAMERGNMDLFIFLLMTAVLAVRKFPFFSSLILVGGAVLKFYPVAGFLVFFAAPWRRNLPWLIGSLICLALYFAAMHQELALIFSRVPHQWSGAVGSATLIMFLSDLFKWNFTYIACYGLGTAILLLVVSLAVASNPPVEPVPYEPQSLFAFRLGAGLYVGAFALGCNLDYRIIFLTFCLPFLFYLRAAAGSLRRWSVLALVTILLFGYWPFTVFIIPEKDTAQIKQFLTWGLVVCLTSIWSATRRFQESSGKAVLVPKLCLQSRESPSFFSSIFH